MPPFLWLPALRWLPALAGRLTCLTLLSTELFAASQGPAPGDVTQLAWFAGCWQVARGNQVIDEQWMTPRAGVMLGMSRTVRAGRTTATEFVTLRVVDGRVVYEANPSGQKPTPFPATTVSSRRAVFENPSHDYPKRIIYQRMGDAALTASIDDGAGGKRVEYPFRRVDCGT
jgi:hypothetical protein